MTAKIDCSSQLLEYLNIFVKLRGSSLDGARAVNIAQYGNACSLSRSN